MIELFFPLLPRLRSTGRPGPVTPDDSFRKLEAVRAIVRPKVLITRFTSAPPEWSAASVGASHLRQAGKKKNWAW